MYLSGPRSSSFWIYFSSGHHGCNGICICICEYVYIYIHVYTCMYIDIACWHVYMLRYICIYVYACIIAVVESGRATAAWLPSSAGDPLPALRRNLSGLGATYVAAQAKSGVENKQMPGITHVIAVIAVIAYQAGRSTEFGITENSENSSLWRGRWRGRSRIWLATMSPSVPALNVSWQTCQSGLTCCFGGVAKIFFGSKNVNFRQIGRVMKSCGISKRVEFLWRCCCWVIFNRGILEDTSWVDKIVRRKGLDFFGFQQEHTGTVSSCTTIQQHFFRLGIRWRLGTDFVAAAAPA